MHRRSWSFILLLAALLPAARGIAAVQDYAFEITGAGEGVAEITALAPHAEWGRPQAEASVATVNLDGRYNQDIVIDHGAKPFDYPVFLGPLQAGKHTLQITRNVQWSAPKAGLEIEHISVRVVTPGSPKYVTLVHAPILYARADTLGHFSDVPLLMWYEVFPGPEGETIQYSFVFSNEDAGTGTPALMARWGRAADIEYAYRVTLDKSGKMRSEVFQGFNHHTTPFEGRKDGAHPYILDAAPHNIFADTGATALQYHMLPVKADLRQHSREDLMDRFPWTYRIMTEELKHEGKIRPWGAHIENAIGDPRDYLYLEINAENHEAALAVWVKLKGRPEWYSSFRGRTDWAISRSGWFRTTVELPPGTHAREIEYIALQCIGLNGDYNAAPQAAESKVEAISKAFLLDSEYRPGPNLVESHRPLTLHPGEMYTLIPGKTE